MISEKSFELKEFLHKRFPNAGCALIFKNDFECLISIVLSAQTTDISVNKVTPLLFSSFPNPSSLSLATQEEVERLIKSIGLYKNKASNIISLSKILADKYNGMIPKDFDALISLPGVGTKTAGVFLLERGNRPAIPVDTHVARISKRLGYAKEEDDPLKIEKKLEKSFPKEEWTFMHHSLILFGREMCHAQKPECSSCPMQKYCRYFKKNSSTIGK